MPRRMASKTGWPAVSRLTASNIDDGAPYDSFTGEDLVTLFGADPGRQRFEAGQIADPAKRRARISELDRADELARQKTKRAA